VANKDELTEFAVNVLDISCEVLGVDNPLDQEGEDKKEGTSQSATKAELMESIESILDQACEVLGVDNPLDQEEDEDES